MPTFVLKLVCSYTQTTEGVTMERVEVQMKSFFFMFMLIHFYSSNQLISNGQS